ncbi:hypothetical protein DCAR_0101330 [Daucus carota subsp. sativus]|uniref:RRM domain-containing protein n=1 Tax=Daucus carota subsp. sativus TaxID=79200 RepID=A0AAF1AGL6_DAUCS|nr:hypothetical protein DCAR_0101330 [Daucus carota subsp. sativus]
MSEEEQQHEQIKDKTKLSSEKSKNNEKKQFLQEVEKAEKRGVCYLSHIPPKMDHVKLRQLLFQYGEIQRIYVTPENPDARLNGEKAGGFRGQKFSEGWVEFTDKRVAKDVAETLNGEQMGKNTSFFFFMSGSSDSSRATSGHDLRSSILLSADKKKGQQTSFTKLETKCIPLQTQVYNDLEFGQ